jgi:2-polyprenyl-6-methoxyphenol hydroxylase-like FAD-dependent oxidoreductase
LAVGPGKELNCRVVVAGGGPAGIMAAYLLARAGIDVIVLEKHKDFLRDFRGDTIHPSTMQNMAELGLLDDFLALPHEEVKYAEGEIDGERLRMADFTHLPTRCKFIAFMPQWDFLNFMAEKGRRFPGFHRMMATEASDFVRDGVRVTGLVARSGEGAVTIRADLVIAADGRHSRLREDARLPVTDIGAPMDVMWFRVATGEEHGLVLGRIEGGQALIMLDRGSYWQCALIIRKGSADAIRQQGIDVFRAHIARLIRRDRVDEIRSFDDVKLLTVTVDRLEDWCLPGLLFIGDAAHAMSPIGGVGINLAIQDAVAAANILADRLRTGRPSLDDLRRVQQRRMFPTKVTQALQVLVQNAVIAPFLKSGEAPKVPWAVELIQRWRWPQRLPARVIGLGVRPEHVRTPVAS